MKNKLGYRVGRSEEPVAWKALNFEVEELDNEPTIDAVAEYLHIPNTGWADVLREFRKREGDVEGIWLTRTPQQAIRGYGDFHGADPRTPGTSKINFASPVDNHHIR